MQPLLAQVDEVEIVQEHGAEFAQMGVAEGRYLRC